MILELLKRAIGYGENDPIPEAVIDDAKHLDAFRPMVEPSILEAEQMEIDAKRESLTIDAENYDAGAEYHERQAAVFRGKKADTLRILDGLRQHEIIVQAKREEALAAAELEIEDGIAVDPLDQMADEIEKNLADRMNNTERRTRRVRKSILAAAE